MAAKPLTDYDCISALNYLAQTNGNLCRAAKIANINRETFQSRIREAKRRGLTADLKIPPKGVKEADLLKDRVRTLESLLSQRRDDELNAERVRKAILKVSAVTANPPAWLTPKKSSHTAPGVPTLFLSDLHWGEVVDPSQIGGVNEYNLEIAQKRMRTVVEHAVDLLKHHMVNPDYPGIVLALGGDCLSGRIHDELISTNEMEIMPTFVDLFGVMIWVIDTLADQFGKVFCPCVTGNHGRDTKKIYAKGRNFTNFDWLLYVMLERYFKRDKRVSFFIPNGPDALYKVFSHRYLLTHGDQARGGDGVIGVLGPIVRTDYKKRSKQSQIKQEYDTLLCGHFHQLIQLRKLIVNGSLKGYDEYANSENFPFEEPQQALWITHPQHGITFSMPVYAERRKQVAASSWVMVTA